MDSSTPPPTDAADSIVDAAAPSPLKLRIVAHLFIIAGVAGLADQCVTLFWRGGIWINLDVLGIFIGRGLLRHRDGWRITALLFSGFAILLITFGLVLLAAYPYFVPDAEYHPPPGGIIGSVVRIFVTIAVAVWQILVLRSQDIVNLFHLARRRKTPHIPWLPRKFSIAVLLYATLLAAVMFASIRWKMAENKQYPHDTVPTQQRGR